MRHNPNPSPLSSLTDAQKEDLISWLENKPISEVVKIVRRDPPDGFGIITYPTSLRRFWVRHKLQDRPADLELAAELLADRSDERFDQATSVSMSQHAFETANAPLTPANFNQVSRWLAKQRESAFKREFLQLLREQIQVSRERIALEREKAEMNAARLALKYQIALQEIIQTKSFDDEDKIRAARDAIFGPPSQPCSSRTLATSARGDETHLSAPDRPLTRTEEPGTQPCTQSSITENR